MKKRGKQMKIDKKIRKVEFIHRPNRFQAFVVIDNKSEMIHVPNTGRCRELLIPGSTVIIREETNPQRKTRFDLIAVYKGEKLINIDSHIPNKVVEEALYDKKIQKLVSYDTIQREKTFGSSRFDFKLSNGDKEYYLEVKGVTLEIEGVAKFPDAPTERGARHLRELVEVVKSGRGAGVIFLLQMDGMRYFMPNDLMDSDFGKALRYAKNNGVDVMAYECDLGPEHITLKKEVEVVL